jgi:dihydrodipicolinate reductase
MQKKGEQRRKKKHVGKATVRGGNTVAIHNVIF